MLRLRRVHKDDCRLLWEWANEPAVREASFSSEPIPWKEHVKWFRTKLKDPFCLFFIALDEGEPIGQVRYDIDDKEAVISVSLAKEVRGKGYGSQLIRLASERVLDGSVVNAIHAYIKQENEASINAFVKAGFQEFGTTTIHGHKAIMFTLKQEAQ